MKKALAILLVVALTAMALLPAAAYAKGDEGESYAIVIGISNYPGDATVLDDPPGLDLFYADDDALVVTGTLISFFGFEPENVVTLIDEAATKSAILAAIEALEGVVEDEDEVVFSFSGHVLRGDQVGAPVPGLTGMLVQDDMLWDFELEAAFAEIETRNVTFIFDACSSGGFSELARGGRSLISATDKDGISGEIGDAYAFMYPPASELPPEFAPILGANQGLFTYFFFVLGIQYGMGDINGDGAVNFREAFLFAKPMLANMTAFAQSLGYPMDEIPVFLGNHNR